MGSDKTGRQYALCINYAKKPAQLTLYHTDELTDTTATTIPVITDEGNLLLTGFKSFRPNSNFAPSGLVWLLRFNDEGDSASGPGMNPWLWATLFTILVLIVLAVVWQRRKKTVSTDDTTESSDSAKDNADGVVMQRIRQLMDEKKPYLDSDLKVADVADALNIRRSLISDSISSQEGCTFSMFVNRYRVEYAKQQLRQYPDKKINTIGQESGFANETSFFRTFKAITGMTPNEWKSNASPSSAS